MLKADSTLVVRGHKVLDIGLTIVAFVGAYFIKRDYLRWGQRPDQRPQLLRDPPDGRHHLVPCS